MAKKIVVADDEPEITELMETILQAEGYQVVSVPHGAQLPNIVLKEKPDLLLLDVLLPGIDGYSLQLQFAQQESTKNIPVIVLTALPATRSLFEKFEQVKAFISKPFNPDELTKKIKEILG